MYLSGHFQIHSLAEGIFALEAAEYGGAMSNAGIIDMGGYTLVFDTFNTPQAGNDLHTAAMELLGQPVRYVVNSHFHGDHVRGNQHFGDAVIVSSRLTRELMLSSQQAWLDRMTPLLPQLEADIAGVKRQIDEAVDEAVRSRQNGQRIVLEELRESIQTLEFRYPEVTFGQKLSFHGAARSAELFTVGAAHTPCDSVLVLPEEGILFAGDVIAVDNHPLLTDGDPEHWLEALSELEQLGARQIVPGHGPVGGPESITRIREYIQDLLALGANPRAGLPAAEYPIPEAYRGWHADGVFHRNLEFLFGRASH
ncbi:MBL fold metallo-hydrolase [Paenibacillus sp. NFR01]|uniref:MBL fold metallo-hydrolase n=1 Tax=Paenibacillus sp. NFR01 TaxID=1566279 RepID=UPI0008D0F546|nr:MBL fold metallo-hydrolase [Paenibacillus sp. NFR01]SET90592.1 Glyoxylase, beta-lactamase superfamily II [Paenibacillus sp. NFR01]